MRVLRLAAAALLLAVLLPASTTAVARVPRCDGRDATIVGTRGVDRITGTPRRDVIVALGGDDVVDGRRGDDIICGHGGADRLLGGPGADRLFGGADRRGDDVGGTFLAGDTLQGGRGSDVLVGGWDDRNVQYRRQPDLFSWSDASRGVTVDLTQGTGTASGFGADRIRIQPRMGVLGSPYADTIRGSADADLLNGGNGDDVIRGGDGADRLYGESRDGTGADTVVGGIGDDLIGSYAGRDELRGGDDEDFIEAYGTAPVVVNGGPGRDQVAQAITRASGLATSGGGDRDVVSLYGDHLEAISPRVRFAVDLRDGTTRADLPSSSPVGTIGGYEEYRLVGLLRWSFHGTPEADRVWAITGGELHAVTYAGNDWVGGSPLADTINAGDGIDTVNGNAGADVCENAERGTC